MRGLSRQSKKRWWGKSENLELILCEMDVRVGGRYQVWYGAAVQHIRGRGCAWRLPTSRAASPAGLHLDLGRRSTAGQGHSGDRRFEEVNAVSTQVTVTHERQPTAEVAKIHQQGWTWKLADLVLHAES